MHTLHRNYTLCDSYVRLPAWLPYSNHTVAMQYGPVFWVNRNLDVQIQYILHLGLTFIREPRQPSRSPGCNLGSRLFNKVWTV